MKDTHCPQCDRPNAEPGEAWPDESKCFVTNPPRIEYLGVTSDYRTLAIDDCYYHRVDWRTRALLAEGTHEDRMDNTLLVGLVLPSPTVPTRPGAPTPLVVPDDPAHCQLHLPFGPPPR